MAAYRIYRLLNGHIMAPPVVIECATDTEAIHQAQRYLDGLDVELWEGPRRVWMSLTEQRLVRGTGGRESTCAPASPGRAKMRSLKYHVRQDGERCLWGVLTDGGELLAQGFERDSTRARVEALRTAVRMAFPKAPPTEAE
jgi:hypothetical protein